MSRSGYSEGDCDDNESLLAAGRWNAQLKSAIRGRRGQRFLLDLIAALDALPEKKLIANDLVSHHSDTDAFDDLRHVAGLALSRAGKTGPVREGLQRRIERLETELQSLERLREICTEEEPEKPGELDRLNPYTRGLVDNPTPTEQPARFIHGVRYYLGMLEDGDSWDHSLGHIQELCKEFEAATDARAGRPAAPATSEDLKEALALLWSFVEGSKRTDHFEAANAHNIIALALYAGAKASDRVGRLKTELAELKSQANEYGPAPRVNLAEMAGDRDKLAYDWKVLKATYVDNSPMRCEEACTTKNCVVKRIEAALGLKG